MNATQKCEVRRAWQQADNNVAIVQHQCDSRFLYDTLPNRCCWKQAQRGQGPLFASTELWRGNKQNQRPTNDTGWGCDIAPDNEKVTHTKKENSDTKTTSRIYQT